MAVICFMIQAPGDQSFERLRLQVFKFNLQFKVVYEGFECILKLDTTS
jgi:hypothetical protein